MDLQFFLPVIIAIGAFLLVQFLTKKNILNNNHFVRIRILLGCIYVGYLIAEIVQATSVRSIITLTGLASLIIFGVYILQKRYFTLKETK